LNFTNLPDQPHLSHLSKSKNSATRWAACSAACGLR